MNNKTIYSKRLEGYNNVKASYEREEASFEKWAKPRALAHIHNARTIMEKYNSKERQRGEASIVLNGFTWMTDRMYDLKIESYDENSIKFSYRASGVKSGDSIERSVFDFPIQWLSMSTWDFNKEIRNAIKKELRLKELNRKSEAKSQAQKLRKQISEAEAAIKKHNEEIKKLEEVYSS